MKHVATAALAAFALSLSVPAAAQQDATSTLGPLSSAVEAFGGGVGQSLMGGDSIFVYAQGRARLGVVPVSTPVAAPVSAGYFVSVSFDAPTAAEAIGKRDALVEKLRALGVLFKTGVEVSDAAVTLGEQCNPGRMTMACGVPMAIRPPSKAAVDTADAQPKFNARATVKIMEPAAGQTAAMLDAVHQAGADNIGGGDDANPYARYRPTSLFNLATTAAANDKGWDEATRNAVRAARAQAALLAAADGRDVGQARQILLLTRTADGADATVTVAVRFDLAKPKP